MRRADRMGDEIRRILADRLQRKIDDPRLRPGIISLTEVQLSNDLSTANVYYSVLGDEDVQQDAHEAFKKAGGFLRSELASELRSRKVPRLNFIEDTSIRDGMAMDRLIERVRAADRRAAERREARDEEE